MIDADAFSSWIGLETIAAKKALHDRMAIEEHHIEWNADRGHLEKLRAKFTAFKQAYKKDPAFFPECKKIFCEIATIETRLEELMKDQSVLEEETYNELLFLKPFYQPFNFIPWVLSLWATIRIYILPGLAMMLPLFVLLAPYLILTYAMRIPITFSNYTQILTSIMAGNVDFRCNDDVSQDIATTLKQCAVAAVTLVQGMVQPYWNYIHLQSVDTIIQENGQLIVRYKELYNQLYTILKQHGFSFFRSPLPEYETNREATARVILHSNSFKLALRYVGALEVLMTLASHTDIKPVRWLHGYSQFHGENIFDFQVQHNKPITVHLHEKPHALLTGPNKGGKSTVLRAITTCMLLAHTYGCGLGQVTLTPFQSMYVCLKPDDLPGSKSRFEREIEFTAETLRGSKTRMVLIDELYHSTNPPDAHRSCDIYCAQLWKKPYALSMISTHLFEFVHLADNVVQRLCCPATEDNGVVTFEYGLRPGICMVSSVDSLLEKNGLLKSQS